LADAAGTAADKSALKFNLHEPRPLPLLAKMGVRPARQSQQSGNNKVGNPIRIFPVSAEAQPRTPSPLHVWLYDSDPISTQLDLTRDLAHVQSLYLIFIFGAKHNGNRSNMPLPLPTAKAATF